MKILKCAGSQKETDFCPGRMQRNAGQLCSFTHARLFKESLNFFFFPRSSLPGSVVTNPTNIHEDVGLIPGLAQWVKGSCVAVAPIQPQAWELPYAIGTALKNQKNSYLRWKFSNKILKVKKINGLIQLLWCNEISSILWALGRRFNPWPSIVG